MATWASLGEQRDIDRLFRRGRELRTPLFTLRWAPVPGQRHGLVIVTPKKVFRRAVDRNRVTRRCRALARAQLAAPPPSYHLSLLPRPGVLRAPYAELLADFAQLIAQVPGLTRAPGA